MKRASPISISFLKKRLSFFLKLELREYDAPETMQEGEDNSKQSAHNDNSVTDSFCEEKKESATYDVASDDSSNIKLSEMRGVYSKTNIPPHTVCLAVPRKCL